MRHIRVNHTRNSNMDNGGKFSNIRAFTLAEVLIVLAIIGVVASLTIPALMQKTQDQELKTALKKEVSVFQQTFQKVQSENGGPYNCTYKNGAYNVSSLVECKNFWTDIKRNFNIVKECYGNVLGNCLPSKGILKQDGQEIAGGCSGYSLSHQNASHAYVLSDGAVIFLYFVGDYSSIFAIDVNGIKPPNQWNKDVFSFYINDNKFDYDACSGSAPGTSARQVMMNE